MKENTQGNNDLHAKTLPFCFLTAAVQKGIEILSEAPSSQQEQSSKRTILLGIRQLRQRPRHCPWLHAAVISAGSPRVDSSHRNSRLQGKQKIWYRRKAPKSPNSFYKLHLALYFELDFLHHLSIRQFHQHLAVVRTIK